MTSYDSLRSIGVSIETADALSVVIDELTPKQREIFYLWIHSKTGEDVACKLCISRQRVSEIICIIKQRLDKRMDLVCNSRGLVKK